MYIGWPVNVNKTIIDSTSVTVGESATVTDSLETGGQKKRRLVSANPPDKYSVTMAFDFVEEDTNGLTELERFYSWLKYEHCYGVNPFEFPAILINSNRQEGESQESIEHIIQRIANGDASARLPDKEYYAITSAVEGSKSGHSLEMKMTWETYATGAFSIPNNNIEVDHITASNGYVDIVQTATPTSEPTTATWSMKINNVTEAVTACVFDGNVTTRYYFTPKTTAGSYVVTISGKSSTFTVA